MGEQVNPSNGKNRLVFLSLALLAGMALRLCFPGDIEYKGDEKYMFEASQRVGLTEPWPPLGMTSGVGVANPGMSVWVFVVLARWTHASTPPELARCVQWLNILGLFLLAFFSLRVLPEPERRPWYWATAFAAVNPFAVLFHRKIWAQCTLPFFCVLFWIAWHYRRKKAGAFFWGFLGIVLGQIHMSGFFLAAGVLFWTLLRDRQARWGSWGLGSLLGAVPLIPWLQYLAGRLGSGWHGTVHLGVPKLRYWEFWANDSLGLGLTYTLEKKHFLDFLGWPLVGGRSSYLLGAACAVIIIAAFLILASALASVKSPDGLFRWIGDSSENGLAVNSALLAAGFLMTLAVPDICRHYLIMSFPLEWVWLSRLGLRAGSWGRRSLAAMWAAQLFISALFLVYLHVNHGDPAGGYGLAYQFQGP